VSVPSEPPPRSHGPHRLFTPFVPGGGRRPEPVSVTGNTPWGFLSGRESSSPGLADRGPHLRAGSVAPRGSAHPEGSARIPPAVSFKILVAGGRGAGKSAFVGAISDIDPLTAETADDGDAAAIEAVSVEFGRVGVDEEIVLYLFCTPEPEHREFVREELAEGAVGAVVLVDLRWVDRCYPAIDLLEEYGIPFAVAVNDFGGAERYDLDEVRDALSVGAGVPLLRCDARDRDSVKQVLIALADAAFNDR
jgi:signal recognition particle receptor subunit beta